GRWSDVYEEVRAMREACGPSVCLKTILGVGELAAYETVYKASLVCMYAGADFIKTSTGKESVNATLPLSLVMLRAISEFHARTGRRVGFKPAGGIRTAADALDYLHLVQFALGPDWLQPNLLRIGAAACLPPMSASCTSATVSSACAPATVGLQLPHRQPTRRNFCHARQLLSDPEPQLESSCRAHRCRHVPRSADTLTFPEFCSAVAVFRPATDSASRLAKVQFVYRMLAIEGNEFLTAFELCSLLQMLVGNRLPLEQVQSIACRALSEVDKDKHNRITNKEFVEAMEGLDVEQKMSVPFDQCVL
uniref:deoxyribose-phosphate aldolase n=1 Tax=Macrostomum lignano TaxID=282301 RepID=A0A1I8FIS0_9PLAT